MVTLCSAIDPVSIYLVKSVPVPTGVEELEAEVYLFNVIVLQQYIY